MYGLSTLGPALFLLMALLERVARAESLEPLFARLFAAGPLGGTGHVVPGPPVLEEA